MALMKNDTTIVAPTSNAASATTRGTIDLSDAYGGIVTLKITHGLTGPTQQCRGRVLIAHADTLPEPAGAGADWKTVYECGGGIAASAVTEQSFQFGPEVRHLEVEFGGNTGQAVTVEAIASTYSIT